MKLHPQFRSEADLCAAFIAAIPPNWTAYPETGGWDVLLVRSDGYQVGIQAKLKLNAKVLAQAVEGEWQNQDGPDYRAVLVPSGERNDLCALAPYCSITIVGMTADRAGRSFRPTLPNHRDHYHFVGAEWHEMLPARRHRLPEYVPDVAAGVPAPLQLTPWKIGAIKLLVLLEQTGYLTRHDFKRFKVDIRRWIGAGGWLQSGPNGFVAGPRLPSLRTQHPRVWDEITTDTAKWEREPGLVVLP